MNRPTTVAVLSVLVCSGQALAAPDCEEIKAAIAKRLSAQGLKSFTLTVIGKDDPADGEVVGSCEHGAKAIVYKKG